MKRLSLVLTCFVVFVIGFALGYYLKPAQEPVIAHEIRYNSDQYRFVNPLIGVSLGPKDLFPQYKPLQESLTNYINSTKASSSTSAVSVYFKNLTDGTWTGVNETEAYAPSSMLKVVVMLAYLDHAEDDPTILQKKYFFEHTSDDGEFFESKEHLATGYHTVEELIRAMIVDSDNDALTILLENDKDRIAEVNQALHLPSPATDNATTDFMSARAYSIVFRALYNATYLSRDVSEKALELLTLTSFTKGIVAGLPEGTVVAHKFGERTALDNGAPVSRELHDCGIVYLPEKPYLLCVMTKGKDFTKLAEVISHISSIVYADITKK